MSLMLLQTVVSLLFALSLFHKVYNRSISTFLILVAGFAYVVLDAFDNTDIGFNVITLMLIFIYYRAMTKKDTDKLLV